MGDFLQLVFDQAGVGVLVNRTVPERRYDRRYGAPQAAQPPIVHVSSFSY
jgi:hypothetical protein